MKLLVRIISRVEEIIAVGSLLSAFCIAFVAVIQRNTTGNVLYWSEEAIIYLIIYSTFFGAVIALRDNEHVNVDILPVLLRGRARRFVLILGALITVAFATILVFLAWALIMEPFSRETFTPALKWPLWIFELSVPLSMMLFLLRAIQKVFVLWNSPDDQLLADTVSEVEAEEFMEQSQSTLHILNQEPISVKATQFNVDYKEGEKP